MAKAGQDNPGTMAAIIGMDLESVTTLAQEISTNQIVVAANHNTENQIVISGNIKAVQNFTDIAKEHGARMAIPLKCQWSLSFTPYATSKRRTCR